MTSPSSSPTLGYVGLPLALLFEESGFPVIGFDFPSSTCTL